MQKKLLTIAVAGALAVPGLALAQSSVEVYGTINMSLGKVKYTDSGATPGVSKWDVANHASNYGLRGRESLGGGLTGWFQIEQNAPLERSNNVAITPSSRNSAVGLQGSWGNAFVGQWTTPWADLDSLWSVGTVGGWGPVTSIIGRRETTGTAPHTNCTNVTATGGSGSAGAGTGGVCDAVEAGGGVGHAFWRRVSQAFFYQSPVFGGAQYKLAWQTNEGKSTSGISADPSLQSHSIQWGGMGGAARIGLAIDRHKDFSTIGMTDTGFAVKGGWNFGVADIGLALERYNYKGATSDCKTSSWGLAAAVPVGTGVIRASYAKAKNMEGDASCLPANPAVTAGGNGNGADNGAKTMNIGYEHRFSKRTQVGFGFAKIDNNSNGTFAWTGLPPNGSATDALVPVPGSDVSTWFVNMTHRF